MKETSEECLVVSSHCEIRDPRIRGVILRLMSEMLDNPDKHGIYPTSEFMWKMETFILEETGQLLRKPPIVCHWIRPQPAETAEVCQGCGKPLADVISVGNYVDRILSHLKGVWKCLSD